MQHRSLSMIRTALVASFCVGCSVASSTTPSSFFDDSLLQTVVASLSVLIGGCSLFVDNGLTLSDLQVLTLVASLSGEGFAAKGLRQLLPHASVTIWWFEAPGFGVFNTESERQLCGSLFSVSLVLLLHGALRMIASPTAHGLLRFPSRTLAVVFVSLPGLWASLFGCCVEWSRMSTTSLPLVTLVLLGATTILLYHGFFVWIVWKRLPRSEEAEKIWWSRAVRAVQPEDPEDKVDDNKQVGGKESPKRKKAKRKRNSKNSQRRVAMAVTAKTLDVRVPNMEKFCGFATSRRFIVLRQRSLLQSLFAHRGYWYPNTLIELFGALFSEFDGEHRGALLFYQLRTIVLCGCLSFIQVGSEEDVPCSSCLLQRIIVSACCFLMATRMMWARPTRVLAQSILAALQNIVCGIIVLVPTINDWDENARDDVSATLALTAIFSSLLSVLSAGFSFFNETFWREQELWFRVQQLCEVEKNPPIGNTSGMSEGKKDHVNKWIQITKASETELLRSQEAQQLLALESPVQAVVAQLSLSPVPGDDYYPVVPSQNQKDELKPALSISLSVSDSSSERTTRKRPKRRRRIAAPKCPHRLRPMAPGAAPHFKAGRTIVDEYYEDRLLEEELSSPSTSSNEYDWDDEEIEYHRVQKEIRVAKPSAISYNQDHRPSQWRQEMVNPMLELDL